jgi:hypothetical protein
MTRKVSEVEKQQVMVKAAEVADHLVGLGRAYIKAVTAPNREENQAAERDFARHLGLAVIAAGEGGLFD